MAGILENDVRAINSRDGDKGTERERERERLGWGNLLR